LKDSEKSPNIPRTPHRNPDLMNHINKKANQKEIKNIKTIVADAQETGLPSKTIDIVFLHLVLHDLKDKPAAIKEFHRILKQGGKLVIDEENVMPLEQIRELAENSGFKTSKYIRKTIQIFEKTKSST